MLGKEEARSWIRNTAHRLGLGRYGSATRRSKEPSSACAPCAVPMPQQRRGWSQPGRCSRALLQHRARARHRHLQRSQRVTVSGGMSRTAAFCKLVQVSGWIFFPQHSSQKQCYGRHLSERCWLLEKIVGVLYHLFGPFRLILGTGHWFPHSIQGAFLKHAVSFIKVVVWYWDMKFGLLLSVPRPKPCHGK